MSFSVLSKPSSADCNLRCKQCFYLDDQAKDPKAKPRRMDDETLEAYIVAMIAAHPPGASVLFAWQGGEPTLLGLDFFRKAVKLQQQHAKPGQCIQNSLQTNAVLIDKEWVRFLKAHKFLVGVSIDGTEWQHDHHRRDRAGRGSWGKAMGAYTMLRRSEVEVNILCTVNAHNSANPLWAYRSLVTVVPDDPTHIQFIPVVETDAHGNLTPESVTPEAWGKFLCTVWDYWVAEHVGEVFVDVFDEQIRILYGIPPKMCVFSQTCGTQIMMEHNGDVFSCDHFSSPQNKLGNVKADTFPAMLASPQQQKFGQDKKGLLPQACLDCEFLARCGGHCPKTRITPGGVSHLCTGYKSFFAHMKPKADEIIALVRSGRLASEIMQ